MIKIITTFNIPFLLLVLKVVKMCAAVKIIKITLNNSRFKLIALYNLGFKTRLAFLNNSYVCDIKN